MVEAVAGYGTVHEQCTLVVDPWRTTRWMTNVGARELGKASRSPVNRIQSIIEDAEFALAVEEAYGLPLIPNKRCGVWYVPPVHRVSDAYFKSTDGHMGQWNFSCRRLNLHLLPLIEQYNGIVMIDSTRRGKRMPDAFSKTVPIWCAVLNRYWGFDDYGDVFVPPQVVSLSEKDQISQHLDEWVVKLRDLVPDIKPLSKPLRPLWVTPDACLPAETPAFTSFMPVVLCTVSKKMSDGQITPKGFFYVQGAADDHEMWSGSLTPELLWSRVELRELVSDTVLQERLNGLENSETRCKIILQLTESLAASNEFSSSQSVDITHLPSGKKGAKLLASHLSTICTQFENSHIREIAGDLELAVAVVLMLDCRYFDAYGRRYEIPKQYVCKEEVDRRLVTIGAKAGFVPSRTVMNIIGSFLRSS